MAKAKGKRAGSSSTSSPRSADTAEKLAALRWLAMRIEQLSIEILVTDPDKFPVVEDALRAQVKLLQRMGPPEPTIESVECPGGYILCRDGLCAPMCDEFIAASHKTRKR